MSMPLETIRLIRVEVLYLFSVISFGRGLRLTLLSSKLEPLGQDVTDTFPIGYVDSTRLGNDFTNDSLHLIVRGVIPLFDHLAQLIINLD